MMWTHTVSAPGVPPAVLLMLTLLLATSLLYTVHPRHLRACESHPSEKVMASKA